ncbi:MAG: alpha-amylase family glycosyl hydrolase [Kiritimatiellae bacterium]|nr:alpha-amylase family glycosyl hydrolase [Kiritimatiellia bacterium]
MKIMVWLPAWFAACVLAAGEVPLRETASAQIFGTQQFAVSLEARSGWAGAVLCDGQTVVQAADTRQVFDLLQGAAWVTGDGSKIEGRGVERVASDTIRSRMQVGDWQVDAFLQLFPERRMLRRWFDITWQGAADTQIKGFWFQGGMLPLAEKGGYLYPAKYPPQRTAAAELSEGRWTSNSRSPYPLVAESGGDWSAVWLTDELPTYSDRGSVRVLEGNGSIRVIQTFNMQGHMRKGVVQRVGDTWLWLQPNNMEESLSRMREWFEIVGQVPPADRPQWLKRVILYSLHPGGTIGSNCKDLGGFPRAAELLPHIHGLGCNAIWLMPLEDKSIYWPRDYYKLQEGLGTPEEYKDFTARARALDLRVWQDCVPHGGCNEFPRAKEHPEWLAQNEDGSTLYYWCFDFNWPTWIDYMRDVVSFYTREYGLDGFRIDACGGSYIPNWNPKIPYARASHAQAQGGLAMQRALREAVKAIRPDGANLAEVGASIHGAVSDSTYDFDLCYNVLHDFRKSQPEVFVPRLRRWLHEQQCAEIPDLVRMRHVESHDSLRSALWYGADAQRALVALTAWIHGIPMVYHEMEDGHYEAYRNIFHVRRQVEELNSGTADYLSVLAPEGVFACLRSGAEQASVVLVNLGGKTARGVVAVPEAVLPEAVRGAAWARDLMTGGKVSARGGLMEVSLPPFGYTVLRFGARALPEPAALKTPVQQSAKSRAKHHLRVKSAAGSLLLDSETGLAAAWQPGWRKSYVIDMDLALPQGLTREGARVAINIQKLEVETRETAYVFGERRLKISYAQAADGVRVRAVWQGGVPEGAALVFTVPEAEQWLAATAEGVFKSPFRVRHPGCDGIAGPIYRLPQGTPVLWDSRLHPFGVGMAQAQVGAEIGGQRLAFKFDPKRLPASLQVLERVGDAHGMRVMMTWRDTEHGVASGDDELVFTLADWQEPRPETGTARLTAVGGGWQFENAHYRARVSRNGVLTALWRREGGAWQQVVHRTNLYTDKGFGKNHYGQDNDVETHTWIERVADGVCMRFAGEMRGFGRFEKMSSPVKYYSEYTFGDGSAFRRVVAFNAATTADAAQAFLSQVAGVKGASRAVFADAAGVFVSGERGDGRSRYAQSVQTTEKGRVPTEIRVESAEGSGLRLAEMRWFGMQPANVFMHGDDLHLAWMDGRPDNSGAGQWHGVSMSMACSEGAAAPGAEVRLTTKVSEEILQNSDFDAAPWDELALLISGQILPARPRVVAWHLPPGGAVVQEGGSRCARVEGDGASYRMARQALAVQAFLPGSVWRLQARMKGAGVERAEISWKTACLRWVLQVGDQTSYLSTHLPIGDSEWGLLAVEMTVPEGLTGVSVEAGMNGNAGKMWFDDVQVERLNEAPESR